MKIKMVKRWKNYEKGTMYAVARNFGLWMISTGYAVEVSE
jgi:hypothetical protein